MSTTEKKSVAVQTDIGQPTEKLPQNDEGLNDTLVDDDEDNGLASICR